jgi:hypothetical protein
MTSPTGGRWIFSVDTTSGFSGLVLGINNGVAPVFPLPVAGKFNIEVFTNPTVAGLPGNPNPDAGFQSTMTDPNGNIGSDGLLFGTTMRLGSGDFLSVDSVGGSSAGNGTKMTLGTGKQTVVGAKFDTLVGGQAPGVGQIMDGLKGNITVVGGTSNESIWGGQNDSIVAGTGANNQIVVSGTGTTVVAGLSGNAVVALSANDTVTSLGGSTQNIIIGAGTNDLIDLTGNTASAASAVIGNTGDTITGGSGTTNIAGDAGAMLIKVGAGGTTAVSGSTSTVAGDTINGGAGGLNYNPGATAGKGDLINLTGSNGTATINAFSFQNTRVAAHDTILATNNADSIFGGDGDRIGVGSVQGAGNHQWSDADTVAGSSVGFGTNSTVAGSTAHVTVGGFKPGTDFLFYQNENGGTNSFIVASSQATQVNGTASTAITLPDGTVMTLVGVTQAQLQIALGAGTLFKP